MRCRALIITAVLAWSVTAQWNTTFSYPLNTLRLAMSPYTRDFAVKFWPNGSMTTINGAYEFSFIGTGLRMEGRVARLPVGDGTEVLLETRPTFSSHRYFHETSRNISDDAEGVLINWTVPTPQIFPLSIKASPYGRLLENNVTIDVPVLTQAPSPELWEAEATYISASIAVVNDTTISTSSRLGSGDIVKGRCRINPDELDEPDSSGQPAQVDGDNVVLKHFCPLQYFPPANTSLVRVRGPVYSSAKWTDEVKADMERAGITEASWNIGCYATVYPKVTNSDRAWAEDAGHSFAQASTSDATNLTMFLIPLDPANKYQITVRSGSGIGPQWGWCVVTGFQAYPFHYGSGLLAADSDAGTPKTPEASGFPRLSDNRPKNVGVIVAAVLGSLGGILAIVVTALLTRCYLLRHRSRPEPGFVIDEHACSDQLEPFTNSDDGVPAISTDMNTSGKTSSMALPAELTEPSGQSAANLPAAEINEANKPTPTAQSPGHDDPQQHHARTTSMGLSDHGSGPVRRRAVHEEDAGDVDVLPPMYREAWGMRHQMQLQDGAAAVLRDDTGGRAHGNAARLDEEGRKL